MNRNRIDVAYRRAVLVIGTLLVSALATFAQDNSLQGKVILPDGTSPPSPVKITLTFNGMRVFETFTDLSGRFNFTGLKRGRYVLIAEGDDRSFETTRTDADISAFGSAPQSFTQNIQLRAKAGSALAAAGTASAEPIDASVPQKAREAYQKALKRGQSGKNDEAVKLLREAIETYPQFYSAHVALGEEFDKLKKYPEAEDAYQKALALKNDAPGAHTGLGILLVKQKKYADAVPHLRRSIELDKKSSPAYLALGLAEMMTGDYPSSETNLLRAYELSKPTIAHIYLANLYDLQHQPAKAIEQLEAYLNENPESTNRPQICETIDKLKKQIPKKK
jgi:tetratricopeptide (TPR) repeat protein